MFKTLVDKSGNTFVVRCNQDYDDLLLTDGWMRSKEVYELVGSHCIFLSYQGHNVFHIDYLHHEIFPPSFPTWHGESLDQRKSVAYTMTLTEDPTQAL